MTQHADILDQSESLRRPFLGSVALHVAVMGSLAVMGYLESRGQPFGNPNGGGGAIGIQVVTSIPLPNRGGERNPVAHDSESQVPLPPAKPLEKQVAPKVEPDAVPLKSRTLPRRTSEMAASVQRFRPLPAEKSNQVFSNTGPVISSNFYASKAGSGAVRLGAPSALGAQFGWYEQLLSQKVDQHWHTDDVDPSLKSAPTVVVNFDIERDGSVRNLTVMQSSGYPTLDFSARRAVEEAAPFRALPDGFKKNSASVEIWFEFKR